MTEKAIKTHGLTREFLKTKGAKKVSEGQLKILLNFLNEKKDLPIVAHFAKYDRDQVLVPTFQRLGIEKMMSPLERWRCTFELAERVPEVKIRDLDTLLEHFGFEARDEDVLHSAVRDCQLTAKVYMKLMKQPPLKVTELGFRNKWTKDD